MSLISPTEALPAAHCDNCQPGRLFTYEERDLFAGELFCPVCVCRTEPDQRADLRELRQQYPHAVLHEPATVAL